MNACIYVHIYICVHISESFYIHIHSTIDFSSYPLRKFHTAKGLLALRTSQQQQQTSPISATANRPFHHRKSRCDGRQRQLVSWLSVVIYDLHFAINSFVFTGYLSGHLHDFLPGYLLLVSLSACGQLASAALPTSRLRHTPIFKRFISISLYFLQFLYIVSYMFVFYGRSCWYGWLTRCRVFSRRGDGVAAF